VTKRAPSADEWEALRFAWRVSAHVKSNAVIFTDARRTLAIGAGQMSRVDAVNVAIMKAGAAERSLAGSVAASLPPAPPPSFSRAVQCATRK
jgi:phosphoribosylaminoimidazolecarboxamide formyltransferase/IMP cyclohydrolase